MRRLAFGMLVVIRFNAAALALAAVAVFAASAEAQLVGSAQGRRDFARMQALSTASQTSLRNRAQEAAHDARSVIDGSRISCDVTRARLIGHTRNDQVLLEVACKSSSGFIVDTSTPSPRAFDCRILAAGAAEARAKGAKVPATSVCTLPENLPG